MHGRFKTYPILFKAPVPLNLDLYLYNMYSDYKIKKIEFYFYYLSISPKTISCVPIIVTTSAIMCPFAIKGNPCKCTKPGAFI